MFSNRPSRRLRGTGAISATPDSATSTAQYPSRLNFYLVPPRDVVSVEEFETCALDRLRVLKALEAAQIRNKTEDDLKKVLDAAEEENLPLHANRTGEIARLDQERHRDNMSHFVLRLAYARSEDLRAWFVRQEVLLFRIRLHRESGEDRNKFLKTLNIAIDEVSREEKAELRDALARFTTDIDKELFFKVHWTRMLDLVGKRKCYVKGGYAYLVGKDHLALVVNEFRTHLVAQMQLTSRFLPRMDEDERLEPVLSNMSKQYLGKDESSHVAGRISANDVDKLSLHFPPCMRHMHTHLKQQGHLKYHGREQYGLFLKWLGLPVEEALTFWRRMFRHTTDDKFGKEYAYKIRHNYGLEGKRANYKAFSCVHIIMRNPPSVGDHHGCPFKHYSPDNLASAMVFQGAPESDIPGIVELARQGHHQLACTRCFEATHPTVPRDLVEPIEHPNQYSRQSLRIAEEQIQMQQQLASGGASSSGGDGAGPVSSEAEPISDAMVVDSSWH
ncbi:hypothetical protein AMAG_02312 [Allomyces macrogynus ATCC 38327]|uniref:DNA primase large subunit n=1 Tax=Allomyces macrogynus (strain ATCC 38327) TaxID=578462 RepID=A0A0L0S288_ALLM3|nr:hypothetical protein AMAG_02312 [Allomyces macrogynus ATCC 38327]|eukprot:KNE56510.1 hypothetical protein AMAG_02312 [Allomyces macrogynus ATCC 38327]